MNTSNGFPGRIGPSVTRSMTASTDETNATANSARPSCRARPLRTNRYPYTADSGTRATYRKYASLTAGANAPNPRNVTNTMPVNPRIATATVVRVATDTPKCDA